MTDWATLRLGYSHVYDLQDGGMDMYGINEGDVIGVDDNDTPDDDTDDSDILASEDDARDQVGGLTLGLGFNYGSFTLDMSLNSGDIFNDPVKYVTGRNTGALGANWTISYNF